MISFFLLTSPLQTTPFREKEDIVLQDHSMIDTDWRASLALISTLRGIFSRDSWMIPTPFPRDSEIDFILRVKFLRFWVQHRKLPSFKLQPSSESLPQGVGESESELRKSQALNIMNMIPRYKKKLFQSRRHFLLQMRYIRRHRHASYLQLLAGWLWPWPWTRVSPSKEPPPKRQNLCSYSWVDCADLRTTNPVDMLRTH